MHALADMSIHATTDNQAQAAAITQRLLDQGIEATYWEVRDLEALGFSVRSQYRYAVLKAPLEHGTYSVLREGYAYRSAYWEDRLTREQRA